MVSTLKENPSGGFYCSECRMSMSEPVITCPFCGSIITNWENIMIKRENNQIRPMMDIDPTTGKNRFIESDVLKGTRLNITIVDDSSFISQEEIQKIITEMKVKTNESNIY